jgi:ribosome-binding ATPase YchF (GTP1/OBG family)
LEDRFRQISVCAKNVGQDAIREIETLKDKNAELVRNAQLEDKCIETINKHLHSMRRKIESANDLDTLKKELLKEFEGVDKTTSVLSQIKAIRDCKTGGSTPKDDTPVSGAKTSDSKAKPGDTTPKGSSEAKTPGASDGGSAVPTSGTV